MNKNPEAMKQYLADRTARAGAELRELTCTDTVLLPVTGEDHLYVAVGTLAGIAHTARKSIYEAAGNTNKAVLTDEQIAFIYRTQFEKVPGAVRSAPRLLPQLIFDFARAIEAAAAPAPADNPSTADELQQLRHRVSELEAARMAYAREFPLTADGEPDVGSIHANIRALKAKLSDNPSKPEFSESDIPADAPRAFAKRYSALIKENMRLEARVAELEASADNPSTAGVVVPAQIAAYAEKCNSEYGNGHWNYASWEMAKFINQLSRLATAALNPSDVRDQALEEAAAAVQSMGDVNPPMSFGVRCADAIRKLKATAAQSVEEGK